MDELAAALAASVDGEVRFDAGTRGAYSTDASNFRQVPLGVVIPRSVDAAAVAIAVCRDAGAPVVSRGGGTSLAGQCTNVAVVIDFSKYCHQVVSVDPDARTCVVEPGIVLDALNRQLDTYGLRFGPEPATHMNCTLGGMIGNNSCGATAQRTGKVVDNVRRLEVLLYDGTRFWCGPTSPDEYLAIEHRGDRRSAVYRALRKLADENADEIRDRYPDIPRRVSGYNLDSLLPEKGFDVAAALVGSESTLVTVLRAELKLVPVLSHRSLIVLGYPTIDKAADAVPSIVKHNPIALEGVDHYLIHDEQIKGMNDDALDELPEGTGYLYVQFGGDDRDEVDAAGQRMLDDLGGSEHEPTVKFLDDPRHEDRLWQVRESGLGATAHVPGKPDTFEGWEDSAVPVDRLGDYLRELRGLYEEFGYASDTGPSLYGHFGQGCVHTRIPFDLYTTGGVATYRRFVERAADLVVAYGGSLSGEHGDGQSRGELLPVMFGRRIVGAFEQMKTIFDPADKMNPGKVVRPAKLDEHLRLGGRWSPAAPQDLYFQFPDDGGSFAQAANRCVGVGRCRQLTTDGHDVMCPSFQVTHEEENSTRGRARLLFEMLHGHPDSPITDGWRSEEVREALDLCLACKGCKSDCPADVDMATYKAEFLAHHYKGRLRPRADYATGYLPAVGQLITRLHLGRVVNRATHVAVVRSLATRLAGLEDREIPLFAPETLQQWWARREREGAAPELVDPRGQVMVWPDTFTNVFHPHIGRAAVSVLEDAGWRVTIPTEPLCCGLTWISTGQLAVAKRVLRHTVSTLAEHVNAGGLVVGLEPSCTAVFRSDAGELFPGDLDVRRLRENTVTLSELLVDHTPGWQPPDLAGVVDGAIAQVHCHQHAITGWDADAELLSRANVEAEKLASGCCGLAGNFGFTSGHAEVSEACAERVLLPRVRSASADTAVLADGFSCRTQIHELDSGGREAMHLAELLAGAGRTRHPSRPPEDDLVSRPQPPTAAPGRTAIAGAAAVAAWQIGRRLRRRRSHSA
jgi:FAD/FMN-containing dehydrogenase/Fe-S oxidoreductase